MNKVFSSQQLDWSNAIGLFIINFGVLNWHLLVYLESRLSKEEFERIKERHFQDRILKIKGLVESGNFSPEQKQEFDEFFQRVTPIRELRNHIAHGHVLVRLLEDLKTWKMTVSLPRDLNASYESGTRHLEFKELTAALDELNTLIKMIENLGGNWRHHQFVSGPTQMQ